MFVKIMLAVILALVVAGDYAPIHKQVKKSDANFTYDSHVETTADGKLKIVNSIENNGSTRLSVKWADAGIACTGFYQLKPGDTDSNGSIAQEPYILDHAEIHYGNGLQYREEARCYVDGQTRPKSRAQTEYRRWDQTGAQIFSIVVISEHGADEEFAQVTFRVHGDLSLILPTRIGDEFNKFGVHKGSGDWDIDKTSSLNQVDIQGKWQPDMLKWLGRTPQFKGSDSIADFVVLTNRSRGNNEISFPITGSGWVLQTIYIVAFTPDKSGFVGLAADIHLPR